MTNIIILGTNGNCLDVAEAVEALAHEGEPVAVLGFLDDDLSLAGKTLAGYPVLGATSDCARFPESKFVNGIGSPRSYLRKPEVIQRAQLPAERWATIVHPSAHVSRTARLGPGTVVLTNVSIGAGVQLGHHVMVLQNSVISHDSTVGDHTAIATGVCVSGLCRIGENCYLGCNCAIRDGVQIGDRTLVGMGAVVVANVPTQSVVMGNPARPQPR